MDRPYTVEGLAERWECSTHAVYALIREKRLPAKVLDMKIKRSK